MNNTLLDQFIEPFADCLTAAAAERIVALKAEDSLQLRINELAAKANRGTLTPAEQSEYDRYLAAFHFVTIMQAHARRVLRTPSA